MNHIYRIIFNRASGVFQVVSELAKGKVKSAKTSVKLTALCMALVSGAVLVGDNPNASPTNEEIKKQYEELNTKVDMLLKVVNVTTVNNNSVNANAANGGGIAIGSGANASNKTATAIGVNATSSNVSAVALGHNATSSNVSTIAIGKYSQVAIDGGVALGSHSITDRGANSVGVDFSGEYTEVNSDNYYTLKGQLKTESESMQESIDKAKETFKKDVEKYRSYQNCEI